MVAAGDAIQLNPVLNQPIADRYRATESQLYWENIAHRVGVLAVPVILTGALLTVFFIAPSYLLFAAAAIPFAIPIMDETFLQPMLQKIRSLECELVEQRTMVNYEKQYSQLSDQAREQHLRDIGIDPTTIQHREALSSDSQLNILLSMYATFRQQQFEALRRVRQKEREIEELKRNEHIATVNVQAQVLSAREKQNQLYEQDALFNKLRAAYTLKQISDLTNCVALKQLGTCFAPGYAAREAQKSNGLPEIYFLFGEEGRPAITLVEMQAKTVQQIARDHFGAEAIRV